MINLTEMTLEELEAAASELRHRREKIAEEAGISLVDVSYGSACPPRAEFDTPYGKLVLCPRADDTCCIVLNDRDVSHQEVFPEGNDSYDQDWEMSSDAQYLLNQMGEGGSNAAWLCMEFVKTYEDVLKASMVDGVQES